MGEGINKTDRACIDAAARAGHEPEEAGNCENAGLNCPGCPIEKVKVKS